MKQILVFGSSITYGAWDKNGGWIQRLREYIENGLKSRPEFLIYNLGVSGDVTDFVLERFDCEVKNRIEDCDCEVILIFEIGTNDSASMNGDNKNQGDLDKFRKNIQEIIKCARKYSSQIVFCGLTPVDDSKLDPVPWDTHISYKNEYIKRFDKIIKEVCEKEKVIFVDVFENFMEEDYKRFLFDGLHPDSKGHEKIFKLIRDSLIKNKIID